MTRDEIIRCAIDALEAIAWSNNTTWQSQRAKIEVDAIKEALAQPEQEPVAWLITDENINSIQIASIQIASIQRLIDRARHAHMTDIKLRINGQDEWHQADWLKHLTRTTPPHRKPLTDEEILDCWKQAYEPGRREHDNAARMARAIEAAHGIKE